MNYYNPRFEERHVVSGQLSGSYSLVLASSGGRYTRTKRLYVAVEANEKDEARLSFRVYIEEKEKDFETLAEAVQAYDRETLD